MKKNVFLSVISLTMFISLVFASNDRNKHSHQIDETCAPCSNYICNNCPNTKLEYCATAFKKKTGVECGLCKGDGLMDIVENGKIIKDAKKCTQSNCDSGKLWEWEAGCQCPNCKTKYPNK